MYSPSILGWLNDCPLLKDYVFSMPFAYWRHLKDPKRTMHLLKSFDFFTARVICVLDHMQVHQCDKKSYKSLCFPPTGVASSTSTSSGSSVV